MGTQVELGAVLLDTVSFRFVLRLVSCFRVDRADSFFMFPSFFIMICYETIYATPWIFPPPAFYGYNLIMRQFQYRIKDAHMLPLPCLFEN